MEVATKAIETTGTIDAQRHLVLDEPLPVAGLIRVRIIIPLPEESEMDEASWLQAAAANSTFNILKEPDEDLYTIADGRLFHDQKEHK